ncbi:MAG: hypothetical protein SV775_19945, partial [Thermodesulfobacteriota bacterium]|nr:hypothetical protein [Thermodesulfobacteriota bacterium]
FQLINPVWPDAQPFDTLFFVAVAILVVWFNQKAMFSRECGVTEVIPLAENRVIPENVLKRSNKGEDSLSV